MALCFISHWVYCEHTYWIFVQPILIKLQGNISCSSPIRVYFYASLWFSLISNWKNQGFLKPNKIPTNSSFICFLSLLVILFLQQLIVKWKTVNMSPLAFHHRLCLFILSFLLLFSLHEFLFIFLKMCHPVLVIIICALVPAWPELESWVVSSA